MSNADNTTYVSLPDCWRVIEPEGSYDVNILKVTSFTYSLEPYYISSIKVIVNWQEKEYGKEPSLQKEDFVIDNRWENKVEEFVYGRDDFFKTFEHAKRVAISRMEHNLIRQSRNIQDLSHFSEEEWK